MAINTSEWIPMPLKYGPPLPETWNILWPWVKQGPLGASGATMPAAPTLPTIPSITIPGTNITVNLPTTGTTPNAPVGATYTLTTTVNPLGAGIITPGSGNYPAGTPVTLSATPAAGYTFTRWSGDVSDINPTTIVDMSGNKTVLANFAQVVAPVQTPVSQPVIYTPYQPPATPTSYTPPSYSVGATGLPNYAALAASVGKTIASGNVTTDGWIINVDSWGNVTIQDTNSQQAYWNGTLYSDNNAVQAAELQWAIANGIRDANGNLISGVHYPGT